MGNKLTTPISVLMLGAEFIQKMEGLVITFNDGKMTKVKTAWYDSLHKIKTEDVKKENILIEHVLKETIDEIKSLVPVEEVETRDLIERVETIVAKKYSQLIEDITSLLNVALDKKMSKKEFAFEFKSNKLFNVTIGLLDKVLKEDIKDYSKIDVMIEQAAKDRILDYTSNLMNARKWLSE